MILSESQSHYVPGVQVAKWWTLLWSCSAPSHVGTNEDMYAIQSSVHRCHHLSLGQRFKTKSTLESPESSPCRIHATTSFKPERSRSIVYQSYAREKKRHETESGRVKKNQPQ